MLNAFELQNNQFIFSIIVIKNPLYHYVNGFVYLKSSLHNLF